MVFSAMAMRRGEGNAGGSGQYAEVAIDLADREIGSAGDRGCALTLLGHLLDLGKLGKLHDVFSILRFGSGKLCGERVLSR
jgi:hypothetical protein